MNFERVIAVRNTKTIYRDGDKCIKVFSDDYTKADVLNEALNQARIESTGLDIPRILEVTTVEGKWAIVSDYIKGKTLADLIRLAPEKKNEYIDLLVDLQLSIHSKVCPGLPKMKDKLGARIAVCELDATTRYNIYNRLEDMPRHSKVCHGDLTPSNIIITEDGTPFIIDWSHTTLGNASADAATTYLCFLLDGDKDGAEYYLGAFIEKSETKREYVERWLPIVAAALSTKTSIKDSDFLAEIASKIN